MKLDLEGSVALVTGGSRGIGAAIAVALAHEGCDVAFNHWRDAERAAEIERAVRDLGRRCHVVEADVAEFAGAERVVAGVVASLGRLDVLVCNAGITADRTAAKMSEEEWDSVLAVNLKGCFNYCRAAARVFKEQRSGSIVNVASINGLRGKVGQANYAASKGGMIALTKTLARELGRYGVRVNAVAPGMVLTEMTRELPAEFREAAEREAVLAPLTEAAEVAGAVAFLASPRARPITGECIRLDCGQYI